MKKSLATIVVCWLLMWAVFTVISAAQAQKTDRQLLTDALATITAIRDRMPADPTQPPALTCAPATQSIQIASTVTVRAAGGTGTYAWNASGGNPSTGAGSSFSTVYSDGGPKTIAVASGAQTVTCQVVVTIPPPPPPKPPTGGLVFTSSWETALGCNGPALFDSGAWSDYGGSGACSGTVHDADVVGDVAKVGSRSLRITQKPGVSTSGDIYNGTDFREVRTFGSQTDVTLTSWLRYDSNYRWASADHKIFIFTASDGATPNVYINYRGGSDPTHARLCMYPTANDTFFCASSPQVTVNTWYRLRVHVVSGAHGKVEMWLMPDGQAEVPLVLTRDAGSATNPNDVNTGQIGGLKLDTTYNAGSSITQNMYQWYDAVAVYSGLVQ